MNWNGIFIFSNRKFWNGKIIQWHWIFQKPVEINGEGSDKKIGRILRKQLQRIWNKRFIKKACKKPCFFLFLLICFCNEGKKLRNCLISHQKRLCKHLQNVWKSKQTSIPGLWLSVTVFVLRKIFVAYCKTDQQTD